MTIGFIEGKVFPDKFQENQYSYTIIAEVDYIDNVKEETNHHSKENAIIEMNNDFTKLLLKLSNKGWKVLSKEFDKREFKKYLLQKDM